MKYLKKYQIFESEYYNFSDDVSDKQIIAYIKDVLLELEDNYKTDIFELGGSYLKISIIGRKEEYFIMSEVLSCLDHIISYMDELGVTKYTIDIHKDLNKSYDEDGKYLDDTFKFNVSLDSLKKGEYDEYKYLSIRFSYLI